MLPFGQHNQNYQQLKLPYCQIHSQLSQYVCVNEGCKNENKVCCQTCISLFHQGHQTMDYQIYLELINDKFMYNIVYSQLPFHQLEDLFQVNIKGLQNLAEKAQQVEQSLKHLQCGFQIIKNQYQNYQTQIKTTLSKLLINQDKLQTQKDTNQDVFNVNSMLEQISIMHKDHIMTLFNLNQGFFDEQTANQQSSNQQLPQQPTIPQIILKEEPKDIRIKDQLNQEFKSVSSPTNVIENPPQQFIQGFSGSTTNLDHQQKQIGSALSNSNFQLNNNDTNSMTQTIQQMTQQFYFLKGKAKKRETINFVTWVPDVKEIKYQKDIKDKQGDHFNVNFSIKLNNIEQLQPNEINSNFIEELIQHVRQIAPDLHQQKNTERKKIVLKGKKRKYCRFHPRLELDVLDIKKKILKI